MSGTKIGGAKAAATNKARYGEDFYKKMGAIGGKKSSGYPFGHGMVDPRVIGAMGGKKSRRGKKL